jgi:hypothetical protein
LLLAAGVEVALSVGMETPAYLSFLGLLSERLWQIATMMRVVVAARGGRDRAMVPLVLLAWTRIGRLATRFERLVARLVAGRVFVPGRPRVASALVAAPNVVARVAVGPENAMRLPTGQAWLVRSMQETAIYADSIVDLLARPGMSELLATSPGAGRVLRQFCRMLGVEPGKLLALPADRKLASRKSRAGQSALRPRVVKPARVPEPRDERSALAIIYDALGPKESVMLPGHRRRKPPWISVFR